MKSRKLIISLITVVCTSSAVALANGQEDTQKPNSETTIIETEIVSQEDQDKTETSARETNNNGLKNGTDIICKKVEVEGTRLRKKKICKSKAQWEVERVAAQKDLDEKRRGAYTGS